MQRPPVNVRPVPPAFLSDKATLTFSSHRDESGERVLLLSWHQDAGNDNAWTGQMQLTEFDATRLREFIEAWLAMVPPPEPREAA